MNDLRSTFSKTEQANCFLESSKHFYEILDNLRLFAVNFTPDGCIKFCNSTLLKATGWKNEDVLDKNWFDIFVNADAKYKDTYIEAIRQGLVPHQTESEIITRDGLQKLISWNNTIQRNSEDEIIGITSIGEDITERNRCEKTLLEREKIYRILIERISDGIVIVDKNGIIRFTNPAAEKLLRNPETKSPTELIGQTFQYPLSCDKPVEFEICINDKVVTTEILITRIDWLGYKDYLVTLRDISERKNAEVTLRKSEVQFRQVWENSFDGMRLVDEKGITLLVNEAFCKMCGKTKQELEGNPFTIIYAADYQSIMNEKQRTRFSAGTIQPHFERELNLWNGKKVWFELSNSYIELEKNQKLLLSVFRDVSNYKKALKELQNYNQKLSFHFYQTPLAYIEWDKDFKVMDWNPSAETIFGFGKEEVLNKHACDLIVPIKERQAAKMHWEQTKKNKENQFRIDKNITGEGREIICEWYNTPLLNESEEVIGMASLALDITERKRIEAELSESEKKYKALISNLPDLVLVHEHGNILFVNKAIMEVVGYAEEEMLGKSVFTFIDEEYRNIAAQNMQKRINGESNPDYEISITAKSGQKITVVVRSAPITFKNYNAILVVLIDITSRKEYEYQLKKYAEDLVNNKNLLEEKASELSSLNKQLAGSEAKLKELVASKDKLFSIIAHDLRSPFHGLLGLSGILAEDTGSLTNEEVKKFNVELNKTLKNQFKFLENLLEWSRLQIGRTEYNPIKIVLYDKINESVNIQFANALKKNIKIHNCVPENLIILADDNMLQSVLQNLISNAIKFTYQGGEVSLSAFAVNGLVEIHICDTGMGIKQEDIDKIFRIDTQYTTKGTANEKGTGLGLVLCKEMIEKHNGRIWVESTVKKGSSFKFTLPAMEIE
ncbi:MAG: PAS domain-containing sensor histidine kinase [Ignavibacteriales bacterium]|nr:PAS domain-containing sensor histidine kinase [Ignavibacteriales bacterium]